MKQKSVKSGETVIQEGEDGQEMYVIEQGKLECSKVIEGKSIKLKEYYPGEAFGELALLYNTPRAATIVACFDSELWTLDRETFNFILREASV